MTLNPLSNSTFAKGGSINIRGPGAHSSADRSLSVQLATNSPDGFQFHSFANDDRELCRNYIRDLLDQLNEFEFNQLIESAKVPAVKSHAGVAYAKKIMAQSVPIHNTPGADYLTWRNCISTDSEGFQELHYVEQCHFATNVSQAMIGSITHIHNDKFLGVHRTAIKADGSGKIIFPDGTSSKMILGSARNGAVKLFPLAPIMGIAEGIETALSAALISKVPVWATLTAGGMASFPIIPSISDLTVFADKDGVGLRAAIECARRYKHAGVPGVIRVPPDPFNDWNDFIVSEGKKYGIKIYKKI